MKKFNEKDIKGCLKRKVKITLSTLIIFTMTGIITYSEDFSNNIKQVRKTEITKTEGKKLYGKFASSGNAAVFQRNGSLTNKGIYSGSVTAKGTAEKDDPKDGEVFVDGEGNGVLSVGYSPVSNERGIDKLITFIKNSGFISGNAKIEGSDAKTLGTVDVYGVGNGIGALGLTDFGKAITISDGKGGTVDVVVGASRSTFSMNREAINPAPPKKEKTSDADLHGKDNKISIGNIDNSGNIEGKINLETPDGFVKPKTTVMGQSGVVDPQWRDVVTTTSGNGVGVRAYINTVDKFTFSEDKENTANIGDIKNTLSIKGEAELKTGSKGTITNIRSMSSGNGISSEAYTGNWAKNKTISKIGNIDNSGEIKGYIKAEVGANTGTGYMEFSNAMLKSSGNGISSYSRNSNGQVKEAISKIGTLKNSGVISGEVFAKAGSGYGENMAQIESSGNGVASFLRGNRAITESSLGKVDNTGMILGKAVVYGGKDKVSAEANLPDKLHILPIYAKSLPKGSSDNYVKSSEEARVNEIIKEISKKRTKLSELSQGNEKVKNNILIGLKKYYKENALNDIVDIDKKISENEVKLKKSKDDLTWLAPETSGYIAMQKDIKNLKIENKNLAKEKESIKKRKELLAKATELNPEIQKIYEEKIEKINKQRELEIQAKKDELGKAENTLTWLADGSSKEQQEKTVAKIKKEIQKLEDEASEKVDIASILEENKTVKGLEKIDDIEKTIAEKKERINKVKGNLNWLANDGEGYKQAQKEILALEKEIKELEKEKDNIEVAVINKATNSSSNIANKSDIIKIKNEIVKLKEELASLRKKLNEPVKKIKVEKGDLKTNTIQTVTDMYASGNGISVQKEGDGGNDRGATFGGLENQGTISGYTEVYHGEFKGNYSRVAHQLSGAGLAVRGNVDKKIVNAGLISGSDFALLAKGKRNTAFSIEDPIFETGFKGGVDNYGLLAGRVIVGGYEVAHNPDIKEGYAYFETIYNKDNKYKNYGMYLVFDKYQRLKNTIIGEEKGTFNGKEIINIQNDNPIKNVDISNKIINGYGENGVVAVSKDTNINNSIVNGYKKAIKVDGTSLNLKNTIVNANGFGDSYAILGSDKEENISFENTTVNGKIDLGVGDDTFISKGNKNHFNRDIDLGAGNNTLKFEESDTDKKENNKNVFLANVKNAKNIEINADVVFTPSTKISGTEEVKIKDGKKLEYRFIDKDRQTFTDLQGKKLLIKEKGKFKIIPIGEHLEIGKAKDILGFEIVREVKDKVEPIKPEKSVEAKVKVEPTKPERPVEPKDKVKPTKPEKLVGAKDKIKPTIKIEADDNWIEDKRAIPKEKYTKNAYNAYIKDYKKTNKNILEKYLKDEKTFKTHLNNIILENPLVLMRAENLSIQGRYHNLLSDYKFIEKDKFMVFGTTLNQEEKFENNKTKFNGALAKLTYGLSDNWNTSLYLGTGVNKANTYREIKADNIMGGVEAKYKNNKLIWTNSVILSRTKSKEIKNMASTSLYSELKYSIPVYKDWTVEPKVSIMLLEEKNKEMAFDELIIKNSKENYIESELGTSINKNILLNNSSLSVKLGLNYIMKDKQDDVKAYWKNGSNEFLLKGVENKNSFEGEMGVYYKNNYGLSSKVLLRKGKQNRSLEFGLGYTF